MSLAELEHRHPTPRASRSGARSLTEFAKLRELYGSAWTHEIGQELRTLIGRDQQANILQELAELLNIDAARPVVVDSQECLSSGADACCLLTNEES